MMLAFTTLAAVQAAQDEREDRSRLSDEPIQLLDPASLARPRPLVELGAPFQAPGPLPPGIESPFGAVWQPSLTVFGTYRTALQTFDDGGPRATEWANRLDLFANLQLTGSERVLAGLRPLDRSGRFSGYRWEAPADEGWVEELNAEITTLFFEGDVGELLPGLDRHERRSSDWGFAVGRQRISVQDGMLIDDDLDAVGLTRNTLFPEGGSNLRLTFLYAWGDVHRDDNREHGSVHLLGLFTESDWPDRTVALDVAGVLGDDEGSDGVYLGLSSVQRLGHLNLALRALASQALDEESAAVSDGYLLFGELSWTPPRTDDVAYVNGFWGIDHFASAARDPAAGGPLGRSGILFASVGLGSYGAALGNRPDESAGAAVGYQRFLDGIRRQLIVELGGRVGTGGGDESDDGAIALGARYQQALGQQAVLQLDVFASVHESRDEGFGARLELRYEF